MSRKNHMLDIKDARIVNKNFAGIEKQYNPAGTRTFCVILDNPEEAQKLSDQGWNIRILKPTDEFPDGGYMLPVEARFGDYPPVIWVRKGEGAPVQLEEAAVGELDRMWITKASMRVSGSEWAPGKIKAYLRELYADLEVNTMAEAFFNRGVE